jgi:hypothetical protein
MTAVIKHICTPTLEIAYEESGDSAGGRRSFSRLQGEADGVLPPEVSKRHRASFTGPYQYRVLPTIGHNPPQEAPAIFAKAVLTSRDRLSPPHRRKYSKCLFTIATFAGMNVDGLNPTLDLHRLT